jgi:hypothetical protein
MYRFGKMERSGPSRRQQRQQQREGGGGFDMEG